ncbi:SAM-dependent methyltransferase [Micromonospora okii]|uniref:SAM-dependent methyltransferase n=1 Tax=Micromonospora okii TaxID=1182970 RepID=UPI001E5F8235|nr:SAM-dependent methyltransferase [Micromonospora okii]
MSMLWRDAMDRALYGPGGFFVSDPGPAGHFRTSTHASPAFASALFRLVSRLDSALGHPSPFDVVDVGAGRGELLLALAALAHPDPALAPAPPDPALNPAPAPPDPAARSGPAAPPPLAHRLRLTAVEKAPRPHDLPAELTWTDEIPAGFTGLLLATEWLDNVPLDIATLTPAGWRYLLVDPATGGETVGDPLTPADAAWLTTWWPTPAPSPAPSPASSIKKFADGNGPDPDANLLIGEGLRVEIGRGRDLAWGEAVGRVGRGVAVTVDYGHLREARPVGGTLSGYRGGRQVPPVPDGSCDVTAHVAVDSVAAAGERVAGCAYALVTQREALRALGIDGGRPPLGLAATDPAGYVRALAAASTAAELTDPAGLGGHHWLLQPVGVAVDPLMAR